MANCARVGGGRSSDFHTRDKNKGKEALRRVSKLCEGDCVVVLDIRYLNGKRGALQTLVDPSHGLLLLFTTTGRRKRRRKRHNHSPFFLVVYFLPRQVKVLVPDLRASRNASLKDFLLKEDLVVLGDGPCLGL